MSKQPTYTQEVLDIFLKNRGNPDAAVKEITEKGGEHLTLAVIYGGLFLLVMAEHGYTTPKQVWEAVMNYEDLSKS